MRNSEREYYRSNEWKLKHLHQCSQCALVITCTGKEDQRYCEGKYKFAIYKCNNCSGFFMHHSITDALI